MGMGNRVSADYWKQAGSVPSSLVLPPLFRDRVHMGHRVLDVGCGAAGISHDIAAAGGRYTGVDLNMASLALARDRAMVVAGQGEHLPFADRCFDVVFLRAVATVVVDDAVRLAVLKEAMRVCGGVVGIQDFLQAWDIPLYRKRYEEGMAAGACPGTFPVMEKGRLLYWARHFTRDELDALVHAAKGTVTAWEQGPVFTRSGNAISGFWLLAERS